MKIMIFLINGTYMSKFKLRLIKDNLWDSPNVVLMATFEHFPQETLINVFFCILTRRMIL